MWGEVCWKGPVGVPAHGQKGLRLCCMAWKGQERHRRPLKSPRLSPTCASAAAACCLHAPQAAPDLTDAELHRLFDALDVDNTGSVDSQEFFAGVLQAALLPHQTHTVLEASFKLLDRCAGRACYKYCCYV